MNKPKTYQDFEITLNDENPPENWLPELKALWFAGNGEWEASHNIAQDLHTQVGSWIHAHLHREEGDKFNAGYWYRMANKPFCKLPLKEEIKEIAEFVLSES